ncbi:asparaginase [Paludibacter sp.]
MIFTGGTISMAADPETGVLRPLNFESVQKILPEFSQMGISIAALPLLPLVDSSDVSPKLWKRIALTIEHNYELYDGFVVLHGTDTMSYTASALSFMLTELRKPVIFTGSQTPMGMPRTNARENIITAVEIAATKKNNQPVVPEVCIFFENKLFRANRTTKQNSEHFSAFKSFNYPALAETGIHIKFSHSYIHVPPTDSKFHVYTKVNPNISILKIFPGITKETVSGILNNPKLKAVILETFGAGNAPSGVWLYKLLKKANDKGVIIVNKSQCSIGKVEMGLYETSLNLLNAGVISGYDCTVEALVAKLMHLLGKYSEVNKVKELMNKNLCGEMTV